MPGVAVFGITGRMGQALVRALREAPQGALCLSGALASPDSARLGRDAVLEGPASGVAVTADPDTALAAAAVAIDFSLPGCVADHARACARAKVPLLVGATGLDAPSREALQAAAGVIPVLIAPNTSIGVAVMTRMLELASAALGEQYDVEISEAHHRMKRDAPSGTALALGEVVAGAQPRRHGGIRFSVVRAGDIVGEHTVTFAAAGERIELTHRATDRMIFARGALRAAQWLIGRPAGLYGMRDVLGLGEGLDRHRAHR